MGRIGGEKWMIRRWLDGEVSRAVHYERVQVPRLSMVLQIYCNLPLYCDYLDDETSSLKCRLFAIGL